MKKLALILAIVMVFITLAVGCGKNETSAKQSDESNQNSVQSSSNEAIEQKVTITLSAPEESYNKSLLDELAGIYIKKNPNIAIQVDTFAGIPQNEYYKTKLAAGQLPDMWFMNAFDKTFADSGAYMELPKDIIDAAPKSADNAYNGKVYQVVNIHQVFGVYYNKDLFSQMGIVEPKTWAEFEKICDLLVGKGIVPVSTGFGGSDAWVGDYVVSCMIAIDLFRKNPQWEIDRLNGKVKYNSPEVTDGYKRALDYMNKGYFGKGLMSMSYVQTQEQFATGKAAMYPMGSWVIGDLEKLNPSFKIGWFKCPTEDGSEFVLDAASIGFSINAKTKYPNEVLAFYKWSMTDPEALKIICEKNNFIPIIKEKVDVNLSPLMNEIIGKVQLINSGLWPWSQVGDYTPPAGLYDFAVKTSQSIMAGADIEKSLQALDQEYDKANVKK